MDDPEDDDADATEPSSPSTDPTTEPPAQDASPSAAQAAEEPRVISAEVGKRIDGRFIAGNPYRFQRGKSGNPKGRPKGLTRLAREMLSEIIPDDPERRTKLRVLFEGMYADAMPRTEDKVVGEGKDARVVRVRRRGSIQHAKELLDRGLGRVPLAIKLPDEDEAESIAAIDIRVITREGVEELRRLTAPMALPSGNGNSRNNGDSEVPE